jgi:predicted permease
MLRDFRHAVRLLRRTPGFTVVAVLVLALGIGVNTAVFSVVNALVLQPRPGRIDQLLGVFNRDRIKPDRYRDFSYPAYLDLRDRSGVFDSLMAHAFSAVGITEGDTTRQTFASLVSANYFSTLGVQLAAGRAFTADEERPGANARVLIASYAEWRRRNLDPGFLGSAVRVSGVDYTIVGIAPRGFAGTMTLFSPAWWFPLGSYDVVVGEMFKQRATGLTDRGNNALNIAGVLRAGVSSQQAEDALDRFAKQLASDYPATDKDRAFVLAGLPRLSVSSRPGDNMQGAAFSALLMLMAGLVLVVACLNLANLLLARGAARRKEIAIRQALGSGRGRIVQQLLVEGLTLAIGGAAVGVVLGAWTSGALSAWLSRALPLGLEVVVEPSARIVLAAAAFGLFSTLAFALGPSWSLSRPAIQSDLKGEIGAAGRAARRFGTGPLLVVGQLAVSLALVAGGGLCVRAALAIGQLDPGFDVDRQLLIAVDPSMAGFDRTRTTSFYRTVMDRVRSSPGVEHASLASTVPFGEFSEGARVRIKPADDGVGAEFVVVGADYFSTMGMHVLRGREFGRDEEQPGTRSDAAIIDRQLARRLFANEDPIGRQILYVRGDQELSPRTVVGVVSEIKRDMFDAEPRPHLFVPSGAIYLPGLTIHVRTAPGAPAPTVLSAVRRELLAIDARLPILWARTMVDQRYRSLPEWGVRAVAAMFGVFGALALLLATIGVYGLKAYDVSRRTREIGIRMALGATTGDVARLFVGEGARTAAVGVAVGLVIAAGIGKLLSGMIYRVSPLDPIVLVVATVTLAAAALTAAYVPARRATLRIEECGMRIVIAE